MTNERISELNDQITQLALKTTDKEPQALFMEFSLLAKRQSNWVKTGMVAGAIIGVCIFYAVDSMTFSSPNESVILALVFSLVAFAVILLGVAFIGKAALRPPIVDWAQRAERVVQEHR